MPPPFSVHHLICFNTDLKKTFCCKTEKKKAIIRYYTIQKCFNVIWLCSKITSVKHYSMVSHYHDTAGIRKKYHYIQTIEISSINFYCFAIVGLLIWYYNKQHFELSNTVFTESLVQKMLVEDSLISYFVYTVFTESLVLQMIAEDSLISYVVYTLSPLASATLLLYPDSLHANRPPGCSKAS